MRVEALVPDLPESPAAPAHGNAFAVMVDDVGAVLRSAQSAEDAFASGRGSLQRAVYDRARADVTLAVATAAVQRAVQSLNAVLTMQV